jgi:transposase
MTVIGIDVSKDWLDVADLGATTQTSRVANTADGIAAFVSRLGTLALTRIGLEATGAYHLPRLAALLAARLPVSLINPAQIKAYRQVRQRRNKTDRQDARLIAAFTQAYAAELRLASAATPQQARLRDLVGYREGRVRDRTRLRNQQEAADWAGSAAVQELLAADLAHVEEQLATVERAIAAILAELPEAAVLLRLTGVGPRVVAVILAYLPVEVWGQVKPAAAYAGVHPRLAQSGRTSQSRLSKAGPPVLRRMLYLAALVAIRHDPDLRRRYDALRARGKPPKLAVCVIMHALLRHMMGALKDFYRHQPTQQTRQTQQAPPPRHEPLAA